MKNTKKFLQIILCLSTISCAQKSPRAENNNPQSPGVNNPTSPLPINGATFEELSAELSKRLASSNYDNFTVLIGNSKGVIYTFNKGNFTPQKHGIIWSASKWVTSSVILDMVDEGLLSLEDNPQKYISFWKAGIEPRRLDITLTQLLNFTAGFKDEEKYIDRCAFRP